MKYKINKIYEFIPTFDAGFTKPTFKIPVLAKIIEISHKTWGNTTYVNLHVIVLTQYFKPDRRDGTISIVPEFYKIKEI